MFIAIIKLIELKIYLELKEIKLTNISLNIYLINDQGILSKNPQGNQLKSLNVGFHEVDFRSAICFICLYPPWGA